MMMKDPLMEVELEDNSYRRPQEFKVVLLGESSVGKTSLMMRFVRNEFLDHNISTLGSANFLPKTVNIHKKSVKLCIWDTAGQERFRCLAPMYYRGATAAICVYDITSLRSFEVLQSWVQELQTNTAADHTSDIVLAIAGNKLDMHASRAVETKTADEYATSAGALFFETSAKEDIHVQDLFNTLCTLLITTHAEKTAKTEEGSLKLRTSQQTSARKPCC